MCWYELAESSAVDFQSILVIIDTVRYHRSVLQIVFERDMPGRSIRDILIKSNHKLQLIKKLISTSRLDSIIRGLLRVETEL